MSLEPGNVPLSMIRGSTFGPLTVAVQTSAGAVFDLTGYSVHWTARPEIESPNIFDLAPTITNAAGGIVSIGFTDEQTLTNFPVGTYRHSLVLETGAGSKLPPTIEGVLTVEDQPTRS